MKDNNELFLLRGCSGSGKSTVAKSIASGSGSGIFEADEYFIDSDGNYVFDPEKLQEAHLWCRNRVERAMVYGYSNTQTHRNIPLQRIVVANTFTQQWEMDAYYDLAKKYGYVVYSLIVENRHGGINIHNVPSEVLERQKNRFQIKL